MNWLEERKWENALISHIHSLTKDSQGWSPSWREWLFQQVNREDEIGSFARMIKSNSCCCRWENPWTLNKHLWSRHWLTLKGTVLLRMVGYRKIEEPWAHAAQLWRDARGK